MKQHSRMFQLTFHSVFTGLLSLAMLNLASCKPSGNEGDKELPESKTTTSTDATSTPSKGYFALTTAIPPEVLEGTPMPVEVPNLEQAPKSAPSIQVPEGTVLLSKGKKVTSSDDYPIIGDISYVTDGDKDGGEGYYVELSNGLQWVQIDLEQTAKIEAIWIWHYHSQLRAYNDVIVQVSDDPKFETGVTTLFNNDYDNSSDLGKGTDSPYVESRFGKLINGRGTKGRYVRLYSNGNTSNDMNHYTEVEVYGIPL